MSGGAVGEGGEDRKEVIHASQAPSHTRSSHPQPVCVQHPSGPSAERCLNRQGKYLCCKGDCSFFVLSGLIWVSNML